MKKIMGLSVVILILLIMAACINSNFNTTSGDTNSNNIDKGQLQFANMPKNYVRYEFDDNSSIYMPKYFYVFYKDMDDADEMLAKFNTTSKELNNYFDSRNSAAVQEVMFAVSEEKNMQIYLTVEEDEHAPEYYDLRTVSNAALQQLIDNYSPLFGKPIIYNTDNAKYMVFEYKSDNNNYGNNIEMIRYITFLNGKQWNIIASKGKENFSDSDRKILKNIVLSFESRN